VKILALNDSHISGTNSIRRLGNIYEDFLLKLDETIKLSKKCDLVLHSGDLFHSPIVALNIVDDIVDRIEATKIPWYITPGNHDMSGAKWETSSGTSLNHIFRRSKMIHHLTELDFDDIFITGHDYYCGIENDFKAKGIITDSKKNIKIAVTHAFLTIKPFRPDVLHAEIKDINCNYNIVLCSHLHEEWGIYTDKNNTQWINVGCWGRRTISEANHIPKVIIIDTDTKKYIDKIQIIPLKKAKMGSEIFDLTKKKNEETKYEDLELFISSLKSFKNQSLDFRGSINHLSKINNVDKNIIDLIYNKIEVVEKSEN
jgi:DNA repair exonuclease SbcCD nuclease subunit